MTAVPAIYDEKFTGGLPITLRRKPSQLRPAHSAWGIAFPFQPTLWDDNVVNEAITAAKGLVYDTLKEKYSREERKMMLKRVEKVFNKLDFDTHRKSVVIIQNPDEERIIHLDFPVKPMVISGKDISLLDLINGTEKKEEFFLLVLEKGRKRLYEYNGSKLRKVYEQLDESDLADLFEKTYQVIELLNSSNARPVFISGQPNLVELFCSNPSWSKVMFPILYVYNSFDNEILKSYVNEITSHWNYWYSKFITGKILIARQAGSLITNIEAVTAALTKKADGLLMLDKRFSKELIKTELLTCDNKIRNSFLKEVENFLARGNHILFAEAGLLKNSGAVALLSQYRNSRQDVSPHSKHKSNAGIEIEF